MAELKMTQVVVVTNPGGLNLRGSHSVSQLARQFQARIEVNRGSRRADAKEILQLVCLGAEPGCQIVLEATGPDAAEAIDALVRLFADNFGQETWD